MDSGGGSKDQMPSAGQASLPCARTCPALKNEAVTPGSRPAPEAGARRTRLVLVDDHLLVRQGLQALLDMEPDLEVIGEAGNAAAALDLTRRTRPDIVITDVAMPGRSGLAVIGDLRACCPELRILVLSAHSSEEYIRVAMNAQANGYVLKDSSREELLHAIRLVAKGEQYLCQAVSAQVLSGYLGKGTPRGEPAAGNAMTSRERQVLARIARGMANKQIANDLDISVKTVEKHRSNLMRKQSLRNAAEATIYAVRIGLVDAPDIRSK
jgi:DNA-binding NarL/FixJ family response regulator